jgi:hypothetical protein
MCREYAKKNTEDIQAVKSGKQAESKQRNEANTRERKDEYAMKRQT